MEKGVLVKVIKHGIPDRFIEHGDHKSLRKLIQLDAASILENIGKNL
jgi:deoxyxylulose-5-phosphate synthase